MGVISTLSDNIKKGIRSWLNITPAAPYAINITEVMDFELTSIRNRIWYRGDSNEIEQMYNQNPEYADKYKFWASKPSPGMEMRKIHTGLPGLIVKILSEVVLADMNGFDFENPAQEALWSEIEKQNRFTQRMDKAIRETLYIGDGAWKISMNTQRHPYPIISWYPGDRVEFIYRGDDLEEIIFKTPYKVDTKEYVLHERYGYGYIINELYHNDTKLDDLSVVPSLAGMADVTFDRSLFLAVPFKVYTNTKFEGRGGSIYDGKLDSFDALDEAWSQWMDALRAGRAHTYIPDNLIPRDPNTGATLKPNPFDNRFIATGSDMSEGGKNGVTTEQPSIPHDSYMATYITALDLCLQGLISPSTLGIDNKKLDNAEAQREKEKTTLYTRNKIVDALNEALPKLIQTAINCYNVAILKALEECKVDCTFGEYANPSFESQVETVAKAKQAGIMSTEAAVDELYGDTRDETWKAEEAARIRKEHGVIDLDEQSVGDDADLSLI